MNTSLPVTTTCLQEKQPIFLLLLLLSFSIFLPESAQAHKSRIDSIDACRVPVGPDFVHFTTYTASISAGTSGKEYCEKIPHLGPTNLVFDYVGKELRHELVEFSVTKVPDGERIFYQAPIKVKTGTLNGTVDFSQYGEGEYAAHISLLVDGEAQITSIPFEVGTETKAFNVLYKYIGLILAAFVIAYNFWPRAEPKTKQS